jgi:hypothetical protein
MFIMMVGTGSDTTSTTNMCKKDVLWFCGRWWGVPVTPHAFLDMSLEKDCSVGSKPLAMGTGLKLPRMRLPVVLEGGVVFTRKTMVLEGTMLDAAGVHRFVLVGGVGITPRMHFSMFRQFRFDVGHKSIAFLAVDIHPRMFFHMFGKFMLGTSFKRAMVSGTGAENFFGLVRFQMVLKPLDSVGLKITFAALLKDPGVGFEMASKTGTQTFHPTMGQVAGFERGQNFRQWNARVSHRIRQIPSIRIIQNQWFHFF